MRQTLQGKNGGRPQDGAKRPVKRSLLHLRHLARKWTSWPGQKKSHNLDLLASTNLKHHRRVSSLNLYQCKHHKKDRTKIRLMWPKWSKITSLWQIKKLPSWAIRSNCYPSPLSRPPPVPLPFVINCPNKRDKLARTYLPSQKIRNIKPF